MDNEKKIDIGGILIGINVIIIGLYLLLAMIGTISFGYLPTLLKLWPIILIAIGLDIIFRAYKIKYIGSIVFTIFLILAIIASVPGATGTGVRKFFNMNEKPVEWHWNTFVSDIKNNYFEGFSGKVVETKQGTEKIAIIPEKIRVYFEKEVKAVRVTINKSEQASYDYKYNILDEFTNIDTKIPANNDPSKIYYVNPCQTNGRAYTAELVFNVPNTVAFLITTNLKKCDINSDWIGDIDLGGNSNCNVDTGNLGNFAITSTSGEIKIGNCKNCNINCTSGVVEVGEVSEQSYIMTVSGDVLIQKTHQSQIGTTSGDVNVVSISGIGNIDTTSGDVVIGSGSNIDALSFGTVSGDITFNTLTLPNQKVVAVNTDPQQKPRGQDVNPNGIVILKSTSGDIQILLSKGSGTTVNTETISGCVSVDGEETTPSGSSTRIFSIGSGKGKIDINTTSGDIGVTQ